MFDRICRQFFVATGAAFSMALAVFAVVAITGHSPTASAEINQSYQNCLCRCGCAAAGWDCSAVSCTFNTTDYDGSPSCAEAGNGPCLCEGFGCGRAQTVTSGECYDGCQQYLVGATCEVLQDEYSTARQDYLDKLELHKEMTSFEYKLIAMINNNTAKLGTAFVLQNMINYSTSFSGLTADAINYVISNNIKKGTTDPFEIQGQMIAAFNELEAKRELLRSEQKVKMSELQGIVSSMKQEECKYDANEGLPILEDVALSDVGTDDARSIKIKALSRMGVINGYADGTYQPEKKINRAEFLKILIASNYPDEVDDSADSDTAKQNCFSDVGSDWYAKYVCVAKDKGIVNGYEDGSFGPEKEINAVEALKIIMETIHPDKVVEVEGEWWQKYWDSAEELDVVVDDIGSQSENINRGQMAEMIYTALSEDITAESYVAEDYLSTISLDELAESDPVVCENDTVSDELTELYSKEGEYTFYYPAGWEVTEHNGTHKSFTKGAILISITESGYSYDRIKELILEDFAELPGAGSYSEEFVALGDGGEIYILAISYLESDGTEFLAEKIVIPNNKGTHNIWELRTPLSDSDYYVDLFTKIMDSWVLI